MHVTACTSFSIATSTEGMPLAAPETDFFYRSQAGIGRTLSASLLCPE